MLWSGSVSRRYGMVMARAIHPTSPQQVHRIVHEAFHGRLESGHEVSHLCGRGLCVNPAHLLAETHAANMARGVGPDSRPFGRDGGGRS
jgi:predicted xylose isomerase-like sugar epimerase